MPNSRQPVVFVDVDDTLVRSFGSKQIANDHVVRAVKGLHADGAVLYCWSSGGADYCREVCERLRIDDLFVAFLPKPDVLVDDLAPDRWRNLAVWHPSELRGRSPRELLPGFRTSS